MAHAFAMLLLISLMGLVASDCPPEDDAACATQLKESDDVPLIQLRRRDELIKRACPPFPEECTDIANPSICVFLDDSCYEGGEGCVGGTPCRYCGVENTPECPLVEPSPCPPFPEECRGVANEALCVYTDEACKTQGGVGCVGDSGCRYCNQPDTPACPASPAPTPTPAPAPTPTQAPTPALPGITPCGLGVIVHGCNYGRCGGGSTVNYSDVRASYWVPAWNCSQPTVTYPQPTHRSDGYYAISEWPYTDGTDPEDVNPCNGDLPIYNTYSSIKWYKPLEQQCGGESWGWSVYTHVDGDWRTVNCMDENGTVLKDTICRGTWR